MTLLSKVHVPTTVCIQQLSLLLLHIQILQRHHLGWSRWPVTPLFHRHPKFMLFIPGEMIQFWVKNLDIWANQLIISDSTWGGPSSPQFPGKRLMVRMVVQRLVKPIATTVPDPIVQNELTLATSRSAAWRDWGHSMKENIPDTGEENGKWCILNKNHGSLFKLASNHSCSD